VLLAGISYLVKAYGIVATLPAGRIPEHPLDAHRRCFRQRRFYYLTIASIVLVLSLSANTAFADFLASAVHRAEQLSSHAFRFRGRRLVYSYGIVTLALLTALLLISSMASRTN